MTEIPEVQEPAPLIVLVEDEEHLAQGLLFNLQAEGYRTHHEADGDSAMQYLLHNDDKPSIVLLDVMLPGKDGFEIVRAMREAQHFTPVLMLTARGRTEDILEGLEAGADDYLPKPFDLNILLVRIKTLLRRVSWQHGPSDEEANTTEPQPKAEYQFSDRTIHFDTLELTTPKHLVHLTLMEADLLRYFTEREGQVISRKEILEQVWRVHEDTDTRAIDNFIVRLRRYIEDDPSNPVHLVTVRGVGYRFLAEPKP